MKTFKLILLGVIVFTSCNKEDDDLGSKEYPVPTAMENFNFYKSAELYNEALDLCSEGYSDPFEIEKVERTGNFLNVTVSYKDECETNNFDVIWDGIIMESWPVQIRIVIKRVTTSCFSTDETHEELLSIDLLELIGDKALVEGAVFHVTNASKAVDVDDPDGIVDDTNN